MNTSLSQSRAASSQVLRSRYAQKLPESEWIKVNYMMGIQGWLESLKKSCAIDKACFIIIIIIILF